MSRAILVLNAGSSSIKFAIYDATSDSDLPQISGRIGGIGRAPEFVANSAAGEPLPEGQLSVLPADASHAHLTQQLLDWIVQHAPEVTLVAAGHRVVHGGQTYTGPVVITPDVFEALSALTPLAPLHQPNNLSAIQAIARRNPQLIQVACFDTSFHRTMPRHAQTFGLPRSLTDEGVIRYGFHGLSYEYIASVLPGVLGQAGQKRVVVAHLGNGASLAALHHQQSVMTTMGFTALHGLLMGRRSGTIDAGIVLHLLQERGMTAHQVWEMLYQQSGLLGVSGISNSMQVLTESTDPAAREAVDLFCYRAVCEIGSLAAAMQGLDGIVFTAGIGENSTVVRKQICQQLGWLGLHLDDNVNDDQSLSGTRLISRADSRIVAAVIPTDEQVVIARATRKLAI
ncbi:MAG: acetate/propionate family kinase [Burkholderiaceae bacterium]